MSYYKVFKDAGKLEEISNEFRYYHDDSDTGKQEFGKIYRDAYDAYFGRLPSLIDSVGNAEPVIPVVKNTHSGVLTTAMSTFCEDESRQFAYVNKKAEVSDAVSRAITERVNKAMLDEMDGRDELHKVFFEAILHGNGYVKYYVEEELIVKKAKLEEFTPVNHATFTSPCGKSFKFSDILDGEWTVDVDKLETRTVTETIEIPNQLLGMPVEGGEDEFTTEEVDVEEVKGTLVFEKTVRSPRFSFVPFQEFYVEQYLQDHDLQKARYMCHRMSKTRYELLEMFSDVEGYAEEVQDVIMDAETIDANVDYPYSNMKQVTQHQMVDGYDRAKTNQDPMLDPVFLYEHYMMYLNPETDEYEKFCVSSLRKDSGIVDIQRVEEWPFIHFCASPINTSHYGEGVYQAVYHEQEDQTFARAAIRSNAREVAFRRYVVDLDSMSKDGIRALLDARPGGVIPAGHPGAITPLMYHQLDPAVVQMNQESKEQVERNWSAYLGKDFTDGAGGMSATAATMLGDNLDSKNKSILKYLSTSMGALGEGFLKMMAREGFKVTIEPTAEELEEIAKKGEDPSKFKSFDVKISDLIDGGAFKVDTITPNERAKQALAVTQAIQFQHLMDPESVTRSDIYEASKKQLHANGVYQDELYLTKPEAKQALTDKQISDLMRKLQEYQSEEKKIQLDLVTAQTRSIEEETISKSLENETYNTKVTHEMNMDKTDRAIDAEKNEIAARDDNLDHAVAMVQNAIRQGALDLNAFQVGMEGEHLNQTGEVINIGTDNLN